MRKRGQREELIDMGKHSHGNPETRSHRTIDYTGRHRATGTTETTAAIRVDRDASGNVTGFGVGQVRDSGGTYDSTR